MAILQEKTTEDPQITIVVGTLNRPHVAQQLVSQIDKITHTIPLELLVLDQSNRENYTILEDVFPKKAHFKLKYFEEANTCKYLNYGWAHAAAPIVLYLDDDVSISIDTILAHLSAYKEQSILGVAGRVINDNEIISTSNDVGKIHWYGAAISKNFSYEKQLYVDFPYGCNMSFRKKVLEEMGGFDENLAPPIYAYNEIDLGYRISKKYNNSIIFLPKALVHHHRFESGGTRNNFSEKELYESTQFNYGYFLGKNFSWLKNFISIGRRLIYQILNEPQAISSIIQGYIFAKKRI